MLHERYMHPNGVLPAYKWAFSDVNPPVHAWVAWRIYLQEKERTGKGDTVFLERIFQKLMLNFTWWVNRKDADGNNVFAGGFLGLDNIGGFDRNMTLPEGIVLEQADGTAWMGMFAVIMLAIAMELARTDPVYEDMAAKLLDHYLYIADAIYGGGQTGLGLWNEEDGFFYDKLSIPDGRRISLKVRSLVGLLPLLAMETLPTEQAEAFVDARMRWFAENRPYVSRLITRLQDVRRKGERKDVVLLAMVRGDDLRHPAPPRATTCWETTPPPGNGALDTRAGWWARQYVVARGEVGGGWALVGARRRANRNMSGREGKPTTYPDQLDKVHYRGEFLRSHANTE